MTYVGLTPSQRLHVFRYVVPCLHVCDERERFCCRAQSLGFRALGLANLRVGGPAPDRRSRRAAPGIPWPKSVFQNNGGKPVVESAFFVALLVRRCSHRIAPVRLDLEKVGPDFSFDAVRIGPVNLMNSALFGQPISGASPTERYIRRSPTSTPNEARLRRRRRLSLCRRAATGRSRLSAGGSRMSVRTSASVANVMTSGMTSAAAMRATIRAGNFASPMSHGRKAVNVRHERP